MEEFDHFSFFAEVRKKREKKEKEFNIYQIIDTFLFRRSYRINKYIQIILENFRPKILIGDFT